MNKSFDSAKNLWVINIDSDMDLYSVPKLKELMLGCINEQKANFKLDCTNMDYIDSTGLGVLVSINKHIKVYDGVVTIVGLKEHIKKIFTITGLDTVFNIVSEG
ncbi:MAG: STAS domain-containing protein [Clostridia bacterium]|nr:STAS domain-containing protein [Clostridia bacterium]